METIRAGPVSMPEISRGTGRLSFRKRRILPASAWLITGGVAAITLHWHPPAEAGGTLRPPEEASSIHDYKKTTGDFFMASADELRQAIATNREKFSTAITAAADKWESGSDGDWSTREIAEHCISSESSIAGMTAGAMQAKVPDKAEVSLASAADAAAAIASAFEVTDKVYRYVEDRDLAKEVPMPDGAPFAKNIEGAMQLAAWHLENHADQLAKS